MNQTDIDRLSQLPVDLFIQQITYLPFQDVVSVCSANQQLRAYCNDPRYNTRWKALINNTFKEVIYDYQNKLKELWDELGYKEPRYNYLIYTQLVKSLDPVTQGMIYYRQGDMKSFEELTKEQKFLALFLLNKSSEMEKYLPDEDYLRPIYLAFISMINSDKIDQDILNKMLIEMARQGNMKGIKYLENSGADIHAENEDALILTSYSGHLEAVKYSVEQGADVHAQGDLALRWASEYGHLEIVKYLVEQGANIHAQNDYALGWARQNGHSEVVQYLLEHGADIQDWNRSDQFQDVI